LKTCKQCTNETLNDNMHAIRIMKRKINSPLIMKIDQGSGRRSRRRRGRRFDDCCSGLYRERVFLFYFRERNEEGNGGMLLNDHIYSQKLVEV